MICIARVNVVGVQVFHLRFRDFLDLCDRHGTGGLTTGVVRARLQLGGLLQVVRRRRRLDVHGEGLVLEVLDDGRAGCAGLHVCGLGVERLAEFHDVDAALTQCRTNRRGRVCLTGGNLQLQAPNKLLSHLAFLSTWMKRVSPRICCVVGCRDRDPSISHERISPEDDGRHLRLLDGFGKGQQDELAPCPGDSPRAFSERSSGPARHALQSGA